MAKIYISSTYSDLVEHRQQVYDILRKMRYDVIAMEDYVAADERPLDKCLADVTSCDVYVGIFVWRYGYIPPGQERSITELEYRQAGESGLERLIFLLHEDAPWPRSKIERGVGEEKIEALGDELMAAHVVQSFKSPEELRRAGRRPRRAPRPGVDPRGGRGGAGAGLRVAGRLCRRRDGH